MLPKTKYVATNPRRNCYKLYHTMHYITFRTVINRKRLDIESWCATSHLFFLIFAAHLWSAYHNDSQLGTKMWTYGQRYIYSILDWDLNKNRTSYSCGCKTIPGTMVLGSRSLRGLSSGSAIVAVCINEDRNRKMRDLAKTSPIQLRLPFPNTASLKWPNI